MNINKNEILRFCSSKVLLLAIFAFFITAHTALANDAAIDMNALDFIQMKVPLTEKNVRMPESALTENKIYPTRPMDAMLAVSNRAFMKNRDIAKPGFDNLVAEYSRKGFSFGDNVALNHELEALAKVYKADMNALNSYFDTVITGYQEEAKQAINAKFAHNYILAAGDQHTAIVTKARQTVADFQADKIASKGYTDSAMVALRTVLDQTYNGLLSGAISATTLVGVVAVNRASPNL